MRKNQSSLTAMGIAVARAVESEKPAEERLCYDPYARELIPGWMLASFGFFIKTGYAEWRGPGVFGYLMIRERYIDDVLQSSLDEGLRQLVILGAGFDSRPYRFEALKEGVRIFEVDHPATQADKQSKLKKAFGKIPENVTFVPIDFNTQTLEGRLLESGYDPGIKTLFIWQGVSMYLTAEAVDATLAFVVQHAAPGSSIVFDYINQEVLDGVQAHGEVKSMRRYRFMSNEGLTFGIRAGQVESFLKAHGFCQVKDASAEDLKKLYCTGKMAGRKIASGYGIAVATR